MAQPVNIRAHAKLNLALSVGTPIPEGMPDAGFHPIASWIVPIGLADELAYAPMPEGGVSLERSWADDAPRPTPFGWPAEADLTVRAVDRLSVHTGRELHALITLRKRIPVGGGLGGGSADAAAALLAANLAHGLGLAHEELASIGATLGSDVPFFLDDAIGPHGPPRPALVTGLGERIERVTTPPTHVVLCVPSFGCDTAEVYRALDEAPVMLDEPGVARLASAGVADPEGLFNDLFAPARRVEPELGELWRSIGRACRRPVHLSGSGSTLFVLARDANDASRLAESLTLHVPGAAFVPSSTQVPTTQVPTTQNPTTQDPTP